MHVSIRTARPEDAQAVQRVLEASYPLLMASAYESRLLARALPMITRANPKLLGSGTYYVAEAGGEAVGCGGWSVHGPGSEPVVAGVAHIRHFGIRPDWTGRGVGRLIYGRCESAARAAGVRAFECYASLNGEGFYQALGFARIAEIAVAMGPHVRFPSVHMRRAIQQ